MKNMTFKIITLAAALSCGTAYASDFGLEGLSASGIGAQTQDFRAPAPKPSAGGGDLIGMDINIRVPFKLIKDAVVKMAASDRRLSVLDAAAPVAGKAGDFLKVGNIQVNAGGIMVAPVLTLKPYLEGRDRLAVRVQRVQIHASMQPDVRSAGLPQLSQEDVMAQVMDTVIKSVYSALDAQLSARRLPLRARDVVTLRYDKAAWTLHGTVSPRIMHQFIPGGLVGDMHLTGFSFSDTGLALRIQTAE